MRGRSLAELTAGAVVLAVAAIFLAYAVLHSGRGGVTADGVLLRARFDRIDGLAVGADVRIAGVKVGSVTDSRIDPRSFLAELTLRVDRALQLPNDTSAEVASEGLLGGKYVSLVPGGAEQFLTEGAMITLTQGSVSLESLLGRFIFSVTQMNAQPAQSAPSQPEAAESGASAPAGALPPATPR